MDKLVKTKVPPIYPIWVCKAQWDSTSVKLLVRAKTELDAWDKAWKKISKTEGGDSCLKVVVLGVAPHGTRLD